MELPLTCYSPLWVEWWTALVQSPDPCRLWDQAPHHGPFRQRNGHLYYQRLDDAPVLLSSADLEEITQRLRVYAEPCNWFGGVELDLSRVRHETHLEASRVTGTTSIGCLILNQCVGDAGSPVVAVYMNHGPGDLSALGYLQQTGIQRPHLEPSRSLTAPVIQVQDSSALLRTRVIASHLLITSVRATEPLTVTWPILHSSEMLVTVQTPAGLSHYHWQSGQATPLDPEHPPTLEGVQVWADENGEVTPFTDEQLATLRPRVIVRSGSETVTYPGYEEHRIHTFPLGVRVYLRQPRPKSARS